VFFENTHCLTCSAELGFVPSQLAVGALEPVGDGQYCVAGTEEPYAKCQNYVSHGVCNWMVEVADPQALCLACRCNNTIPNLESEESRALWAAVETAKRQLMYTLFRLRLPLVAKGDDAEHGVAFDIKAETGSERVLTGHADGIITLNLAEADPVARERIRVAMNERYRTLLGHFRHEIGHYYWERLIRDTPRIEPFRARFGDEREDYAEALRRHYDGSAPPAADGAYVTSYASAHPWEDWAEIFAHYLHIIDTLETAQHFGFAAVPSDLTPRDIDDFDLLMREWLDLTIALNALNRSMGLPDMYPFAISDTVRNKLAFVHDCVAEGSWVAASPPDEADQPTAPVDAP
jgi:hypothetical protein